MSPDLAFILAILIFLSVCIVGWGFVLFGIGLISWIMVKGRTRPTPPPPLHPWDVLAQRHQLKFDPRFTLFDNLGDQSLLSGSYQGYHLVLRYTSNKYEGKTKLVLSSTNQHIFDRMAVPEAFDARSVTVEKVVQLLAPAGVPAELRGRIDTSPGGQSTYYQQQGLEEEVEYLQTIFDLSCDIMTGYPKVVALGGVAVPALLQLVFSQNPLQYVAERCLRTIGWETKHRLSHRITLLLCSYCLVHGAAHRVKLSWWQNVIYYGCRQCGQSRGFWEITGPVVAVLDIEAGDEVVKQEGQLRVNWFAHLKPFDFDRVEIVHASDEAVERFVVQIGNDTDMLRRPRYRQMVCRVASACGLSVNTMRILQKNFGRVETIS